MRFFRFAALLFTLAFLACSGNKTALIWTDRPELALYGEYFITAQERYKVEIRYFDSPAGELKNAAVRPDIVIGRWLKSASTGTYFKPLDNLFGANKLSRSVFYPQLLTMGRVERSQYFLPVSFNAPAIVFARDKAAGLSDPFTISFEEIKKMGKAYNAENRGVYTRMGFSPFWNDDFLFITATLFGASFREAAPIAWNSAALNRSMNFIYDWTHEANTGNNVEEEFTFKYFFEPPIKMVQSGRILFTFMESNDFFTLSEDSRRSLDFRWIAEQNVIPLAEDSVYLGLPKKGKSPQAAKAFVLWFFQIETQRQLLESSRANRMDETVFGICGGFSALNPVTEQIFPKFYIDLLGHMPPAELLSPANILPGNWTVLKERIILPYLSDRARRARTNDVYPLERRLSDWLRVNR
jgi:ABC-type glycerol-3-phosphate transport system substrate-binding protein